MFDIGWPELVIVALIALLVIGPKELPNALRTVAGWVGRMRALAREFQSGLDDIVRETELDKLKQEVDNAANVDLDDMVGNTIDPDGTIGSEFDHAGYEAYGEPFAETKPIKPKPKRAAKQKPAAKRKPAAAAKKKAAPKRSTTPAKPKAARKPAAASAKKAAPRKQAATAPKTRAAKTKAAKTPAAKTKAGS